MFDQPLKQWLIGGKRGEDRNTFDQPLKQWLIGEKRGETEIQKF